MNSILLLSRYHVIVGIKLYWYKQSGYAEMDWWGVLDCRL